MLLVLPSVALAVVCKTVGEDGVASYTDVPASECPKEIRIRGYSRPGGQTQSVNAISIDQKATFAGYRSIEIVSPENNGIVRSNNRKVPVEVKLKPGLKHNHFITIYLDHKVFRGRYGSSNIELTKVDPGTHQLRATVTDTRGKTVVESRESSFTLLLQSRVRVPVKVTASSIEGTFKGGSTVTIHFPASDNEYYGEVGAGGNWSVGVGEAGSFEVKIRDKDGDLVFDRFGSKPGDWPDKPSYEPDNPS